MKKVLTSLMMLMFTALSMFAETVTVDLTAQGFENAQAVETVTSGDVTLAFDKGTNNNAPKFYTSGNAVRLYGSNSMTVSANGANITAINLTFGSGDGSNPITATPGSFSTNAWTGEATEVVFTIGGTSGNRRFAKIEVTYEAASNASLGEPVWGVEVTEEGFATIEADMINLGVPVTFPNVVLPENLDPLSLNVTVSASLYGIPSGNEPMPISGEEGVGDENMGVDGPVAIAEAQLHNAYIDATGLHAYLFPEMLEEGNHYGIIINAVTVMDGEDVVLTLDEEISSPEIVVVPATVEPSFGGVAFNIEEGAEITVDDVHNLAIKMYFPEATGFEGYAFYGDAMLVKQNAEGEWDYVDFAELYSEYAEDMMDTEWAPTLFAEALQNAVAGETYRVLAIDYALINAEGEPVIFESYENPATAPYVTFTVVNEATGINSVNASAANVMFNIAGQRVNNAKGIVIMNGKKMVRK